MSVIYGMKCSDCGKALDFICKMDSNEDLIVTVEPCDTCMDEAKQDAYNEGAEDANK